MAPPATRPIGPATSAPAAAPAAVPAVCWGEAQATSVPQARAARMILRMEPPNHQSRGRATAPAAQDRGTQVRSSLPDEAQGGAEAGLGLQVSHRRRKARS